MFSEREREEPRIEVSSLVDVVFLLLIFFMVTTRFAEQPAVEIELPSTEGEAQRVEETVPELLVDGSGGIRLDGRPVARSDLRAALDAAFAGRGGNARQVHLDADRKADWETMAAVFDACRKAGVELALAFTDPSRTSEGGAP